jgi:hypothetical protein
MNKNIWSLGLLRNGKVYATRELALQAFSQSTNDGVAKLCRYLGEGGVIKTIIGFYANADEMTDAGGGSSYYTIIDLEGIGGDVAQLQSEIDAINAKIGTGIEGETLTSAINDINERLGSGFTANHTVADALAELNDALTQALTVTLEAAETPTAGYLKTYVLSQGGNEVGKIDIPKDMVVSGGSLVHGTWSGDTFTEDPNGPDSAIKIEFANANTIYINTKDLVDFYTSGNAGIVIDNDHNSITLTLDPNGEAFLTISENGLKLDGIQAAINAAVRDSELSAGNGINIAANTVTAVAAKFSGPGITNPITVESDGIKFAEVVDCGFFDDEKSVANTAADIAGITNPSNTDVFVNTSAALNSMTVNNRVYKSLEVSNVEASNQVFLKANEFIVVDGMEITGSKGSTNGYVNYSAPKIEISNLTIENGSTAYNVFEGEQTLQNLELLDASNIKVDNPSLAHNVFNVYKPKNDAIINIKDGSFNLTVDNANVLRISNTANATGVTVNFENVDWTYENGLTSNDWSWAGLVIYQPYGSDNGISGVLTEMRTWTFNFKNCRYNGIRVNANNFGMHNQVFYLYNVGNDGSIKDPVTNGFTLNFE